MNLQEIGREGRFSFWLDVDTGLYIGAAQWTDAEQTKHRMTEVMPNDPSLSDILQWLDTLSDLLPDDAPPTWAEAREMIEHADNAEEYLDMRLTAYQRHGDVNAFG